MAINNRSKKIEKQILEDVVMVEEPGLPDLVLEETDNMRMPFYKFSAHQTIEDQEFLYSLLVNWGLQVQHPNSVGSGENLSLFLTHEFFDLLVEQTDLYAPQYKYKILICPQFHVQVHGYTLREMKLRNPWLNPFLWKMWENQRFQILWWKALFSTVLRRETAFN